MRVSGIRQPAADESRIDLTPMLDVVFIMLIFFIVTASFIRETGLEVVRGEGRPDSPEPVATALVTIDAVDAYRIDNRTVAPAALRANLIRLLSLNPELSVVVQPDRASSAQALVRALDAANAAHVVDVVVAEAPRAPD